MFLALTVSFAFHLAVALTVNHHYSELAFTTQSVGTSLSATEVTLVRRAKPEPKPVRKRRNLRPKNLRHTEMAVRKPVEESQVQSREERPAAATAALAGSEADLATVLSRNAYPRYPYFATRMGYQGTVVFMVQILPDGRCGQIKTVQSSGYRLLDSSAKKTISTWNFSSVRHVEWLKIPITFKLTS